MVQRTHQSKDPDKKGTINTSFGSFNLYSLRNHMNNLFRFNSHTIILLISSIILLILSAASIHYHGVELLFLVLGIDTLIASIIVKPIYYFKGGYEIQKSSDFKRMIINPQILPSEIKNYLIYLFIRLIIYVLLLFTAFTDFLRTNFKAIQVYTYIFWSLVVSVIGILFIVSMIMASLGFLIDDYLNEGTSHKVWKDLRLEISNSALELDNVISRLTNSQNTVINQQYRQKLAGAIFKLRNYLVIENQPDPNYTPEMKIKFVNTEKEFSKELLDNLRKDKCVVCYSQLQNATGSFLVCPICGQGGHKEHIEEWFTSKTTCPGCNSDLSASNFLVLG